MRSHFLIFVTALLLCSLLVSGQQAHSFPKPTMNDSRAILETGETQGERKQEQFPLAEPRVVVYKSARKLELYSAKELIRSYRVALGFNPIPDKVQEGDGATPEGEFYIFSKNPKSAYYLSLAISYPNAEDADRGFRDKLITKAQRNSILQAITKRKAPPQHTKLGGLIYIHGYGTRTDWTLGCVALENEDMKELFEAVSLGTPVTIRP